MEGVIDLHLAECIEALDVLANKDSNLALLRAKSLKSEKLCETAEKIFKFSQSIVQDEEKTYIFLRRFLRFYDTILSLPNSDKQYVTKRLKLEVKTANEQFPKIKMNLEKRYEGLKPVSRTTQSVALTPKALPEFNIISYKFKDDFITCRELFKVHEELKENLLVMDARSTEDFTNSKMKQLNSINIPEECIKEGLSANLLGKSLPIVSQMQWNKRENFSLIVLVDWQCTPDMLPSVPLGILKDILLNWDLVKYDHTPIVLHGGYLEWLQTYPMYSTNSQVVHIKANLPLDELLGLDEINYPSMTDKNSPTVRTQTRQQSISKPIINRATKPTLPSRDSLLKQEQLVVEEQLKIEQELVHLEQNFAINKDKPHDGDANIENLLKRIEELEENKAVLEESNTSLKNQIELFASFNPAETVDNSSAVKILSIEEEKNKVSKERKALKKNREEFLQDDDKNKANFKTLPSTPHKSQKRKNENSIPKVNRTTKPVKTRNFRPKCGETSKGITGLQNIGNICYMNSILQCLGNTTDLTKYFCMGKYIDFVNMGEETCGKIALEYGALIRTLWCGAYVRIYADDFKEEIAKFAPRYRGTDHQDAHELLQTIVNWLHDELRFEIQTNISQSPSSHSWNQHFQNKHSFILEMFFFQLRTERTCSWCKKSSVSFEVRQDVMVDVPNCKSTLDDCLREYFKPEIMDDWVCGNCRAVRELRSVTTVSTVPAILIVTLKRFCEKTSGRKREFARNNNVLDYPLHLRFGGSSYNLYAVCEHTGTLDSGHYTATCFNVTTQRWVHFNDEYVTVLGRYEEHEKSPTNAYILFYSNNSSIQETANKIL